MKNKKKKNKKKNNDFKSKKELLGGLIIVVLLLLVLVTYVMCYNYKKQEDNKKIEIKDNSLSMINIYDDYTISKIIDKDSIDNTKKILGTYNCKYDDCEVYNTNSFANLYNEKFLILKENNKVFIYNFIKDKTVSNLYDEIVIKLENNNYLVKDNNKYGMINNEGKEITSPTYDEILYNNITDNKVKIKNNNLYGILNIQDGTTLIYPKYENINIDNFNYSILKNGLWYVIDDNENILTNGYLYTFSFGKGVIVLIDNSLQILKYNKENNELLNETIIPIYEENGYKIERIGSNINIEVYNGDTIIKWKYNINRNNLTNIE